MFIPPWPILPTGKVPDKTLRNFDRDIKIAGYGLILLAILWVIGFVSMILTAFNII